MRCPNPSSWQPQLGKTSLEPIRASTWGDSCSPQEGTIARATQCFILAFFDTNIVQDPIFIDINNIFVFVGNPNPLFAACQACRRRFCFRHAFLEQDMFGSKTDHIRKCLVSIWQYLWLVINVCHYTVLRFVLHVICRWFIPFPRRALSNAQRPRLPPMACEVWGPGGAG